MIRFSWWRAWLRLRGFRTFARGEYHAAIKASGWTDFGADPARVLLEEGWVQE